MENNAQNTTNNMQPKKSHKLFWIIGIGIIVILLIAIGTQNSGNDKKDIPAEQIGTAAPASDTSSEKDTPTEPVSTAASVSDTSSGKLGDYDISILNAEKVTDYEGNPGVIVNFDYTNNSSDSQMFSTSVTATAYQNGVELSPALILDGSYDSEASLKNIKPGISIKVQKAYVLDDPSAPVTVEVTEWLSFNDKKLTKEFTF